MPVNTHLEVKSLAFVMLGDFNPALIQPFWLAKKELIRESEAQQTKVELIHNELVRFDLGWAKFDVKPDRFEISTTSEPHFGLVRDLIIGIFTFLNETPIKAVGINFVYDINLKTAEKFYSFGNTFAPLKNWDFLNEARVVNLEFFEKDRSDKLPGHYRIRIQSSNAISSFGVNIVITDHVDVDTSRSEKDNGLVKLINSYWPTALEKADRHMDNLWNKFEQQNG
ncbi:hypothetical protein FO440_24050 [Mucilaginibacter corticis]|uniref:TIGR04255 family protein n=1 Tax=Mucilaginibacter corticis TaxID=2597670 RepID=A0A556M4W3_9SPHI|nr:hypothetical protein [Mucilaginibacter corticis]TSJ34915.1 hypothetical protein FO440_24050 [Mucilaginibacter corticis]